MNEDNTKLLAAALKRLHTLSLAKCINPQDPASRPYPKQQEILEDIGKYTLRIVRAGNQSGKSAIGGREVSWVLERQHPYYSLPERPLKILVIGRVGEQVESELWRSKIKPFLTPGTYKEIRIGNILQRVEHDNGNLIIFMSHHNINEAREKVQSFVADYVWLDEQVASLSFLIELVLRIQANAGRLLWTFTPLIRSQELVTYCDNLDPAIGKVYSLFMLDNPVYRGREDEILAQFANMSAAERDARLYGIPFVGDNAVYSMDPEKHLEFPPDYHPGWRHVEAVDPAASSKAGYILLAEHPLTHVWYVIKGEYINGAAASDLLPTIRRFSNGVNIVRRVADPHEVWFIKEAARQGTIYCGVYRKKERKKELIKAVQETLNEGRLKIAPDCDLLIDEFSTCQWSETGTERIVGASRFHLLDALQYAVDNLPAPTKKTIPLTFDQAIKESHRERKRKQRLRGGRVKAKLWARRGRRGHVA